MICGKGSAQIMDFISVLSLHSPSLSSMKFYPNPTSSILNIEMGMNLDYDITIYNIMGQQVVKQYSLSGNKTLDVSKLKSGIYLLKTSTADGNSQTVKFVKN